MTSFINSRVLKTPLDSADGSLGAKKLLMVVIALLVIGGAMILGGQRLISNHDTWPATVTGVARTTVNFTFDQETTESEVADYPAGMDLEEGDRVLIRIDEDEGNFVERVID